MSEEFIVIDAFGEDAPTYGHNFDKDVKEIKKSLIFEQDFSGVYIIAVAIHKDETQNCLLEIPAKYGDPLSQEVYDLVRDSYHVEGVSYHEVGMVPVNYRVRMENMSWAADVPLPPSVLKRYMSSEQQFHFDRWKDRYPQKDFSIHYLQLTGLF